LKENEWNYNIIFPSVPKLSKSQEQQFVAGRVDINEKYLSALKRIFLNGGREEKCILIYVKYLA